MYKNNSVGIVVPAYNEEGFVGDVLETLPAYVDRAYVVDDCSTDGTWNEIQETIAAMNDDWGSGEGDRRSPWIEAIQHDENRGVGAAIKTGYRRAAADDMDVTAVMNGDGQMDPAVLDRIIDPVVEGRADYAKGNRLLSRDHVGDMSAWRRFGNGVLSFLTKVASGYWKTMDSQNGYTAISSRALNRLDLDALYDRYGFCNDVLVRLNAHQMRVADVEMQAVYGDETSSIRYHRFIPVVSLLLLRGFLWRLKVRYLVFDFHPLIGFYLIGSVASAAGLVGLVGAALAGPLRELSLGTDVGFSVQMLLVGLLSALGAMTLDRNANEELEEKHLTTTSDPGHSGGVPVGDPETVPRRTGGTPASGVGPTTANRTNGESATSTQIDETAAPDPDVG